MTARGAWRWLAAAALAGWLGFAAAAPGTAGEDADHARQAVREGRFVSLTSILDWLERHYLGHVLEVELEAEEDDEPPTYEIEWLTPQNHVIEFEFDARSGALLETEGRGVDEARRR
jgi:uncharacterized membrane protein YkoI